MHNVCFVVCDQTLNGYELQSKKNGYLAGVFEIETLKKNKRIGYSQLDFSH